MYGLVYWRIPPDLVWKDRVKIIQYGRQDSKTDKVPNQKAAVEHTKKLRAKCYCSNDQPQALIVWLRLLVNNHNIELAKE